MTDKTNSSAEGPAVFNCRILGGNRKTAAEEVVPHQDSLSNAYLCMNGGNSPTGIRIVYDIVMNKCCDMKHLNGRGNIVRLFFGELTASRREKEKGWPEHLTLCKNKLFKSLSDCRAAVSNMSKYNLPDPKEIGVEGGNTKNGLLHLFGFTAIEVTLFR